MASVREWQFKRKFRTNAYGWRASSLAIGWTPKGRSASGCRRAPRPLTKENLP